VIHLNPSQLTSTFFGLTSTQSSEARKNVFTQIHEVVFHGKGGYDWYTVYNMPIWLRRYTFSQIQKFYKDENTAMEKAQSKNKNKQTAIGPDGKINPTVFQRPTKSNYK
jgi:hypothetical protein